MSADNLGYSDADFWADPDKEIDDVPPDGLYLAAPNAVVLSDRQTLPVVARRAASLRESIAVDFRRFAILHGIDLASNRASAAFVFEQDNLVYTDLPPAELDEVAEGARTVEPFFADVRERLGFPWKPAELLLTITVRDRVSNRRRVKLGAGASAYDDPAVREYLEKRRADAPRPPPFPLPGNPLPAYVPIDGSPPVPNEPGIAISADRVVDLREGATCILRGAFRVPVGKDDLVRPEQGERHTAVVAIHLVITGADDPSPTLLTIRAPVYGEAEAGKPAAGHFAFDLLTMFAPADRTETYFLYAFSRDVMLGPQPLAFVAPDGLPRRRGP
jgi:hypothetical protein